jgi:hypothetical protein
MKRAVRSLSRRFASNLGKIPSPRVRSHPEKKESQFSFTLSAPQSQFGGRGLYFF